MHPRIQNTSISHFKANRLGLWRRIRVIFDYQMTSQLQNFICFLIFLRSHIERCSFCLDAHFTWKFSPFCRQNVKNLCDHNYLYGFQKSLLDPCPSVYFIACVSNSSSIAISKKRRDEYLRRKKLPIIKLLNKAVSACTSHIAMEPSP